MVIRISKLFLGPLKQNSLEYEYYKKINHLNINSPNDFLYLNISFYFLVGGICANLVGLLAVYWGPSPMVVMGIVAIIAGLSALKLPETVGNKLPETMDEAINIGKDSKRGICTCVCPKSLYEMFKED